MNSEQTWSSHIVGRRHIKNVEKYPNGLPKRKFPDDEDSYGSKGERYNDEEDYPPAKYGKYYYDMDPEAYEPVIKPNVVIDYGHKKTLEDILPQEAKTSEVLQQERKSSNTDAEKPTTTKSVELEPLKDDFFEKLNQKEIAKELAKELAKSDFCKNEIQDKGFHKKYLKPEKKETSHRKQEEKHKDKKSHKGSPPLDFLEIFHKYNDHKLFKESKTGKGTSKSKTKAEEKINKIDPDKLTPDMLDDLLSSYLKPKIDSIAQEAATSIRKKVNIDNPEVIAQKLETLPTKTFLKLIHDKLIKMDLKDSEELNMLVKIISVAQEIVRKNLPAQLQALVKAKMSESSAKTSEADIKKTVVSNISLIQSFPTISTVPQFASSIPVSVSSSLGQSTSTTSTIFSPTQTVPGRFATPGVPNTIVYPSVQNHQTNTVSTQRLMQYLKENGLPLPSANINSVPSTLSSQIPNCQQPVVSQSLAVQQPVVSQYLAAQQPAVSQSLAVQQAVASLSRALQQPVVSQSRAIQQPVVSQSRAIQQPIFSQRPSAQQPGVSQRPSAQQPGVSQRPLVRQPVMSQKPAVSQPQQSTVSQEEVAKNVAEALNKLKKFADEYKEKWRKT